MSPAAFSDRKTPQRTPEGTPPGFPSLRPCWKTFLNILKEMRHKAIVEDDEGVYSWLSIEVQSVGSVDARA